MGVVIPLKQSVSRQKKSLTNLFISAYCHKKKDQFKVPRMRIRKTNFETESFPKTNKIPVLTFQLKERDKVLGSIRQAVLKTRLELLYKDKSSKAFPFPFAHAMAGFALPKDYKKRDLRIVVLSPQGKKIYSAPIPKKRKKKDDPNNQNIVWIDETYKKE